jgi:hypothetical protein
VTWETPRYLKERLREEKLQGVPFSNHLFADDIMLGKFRQWDGNVAVGGRVESLTVEELNGVPLTVVVVVGKPLSLNVSPYPVRPNDTVPTYEDGLLTVDGEWFYTFLGPEGSGLSALAETALLGKADTWMWGRVSTDDEGWHESFALPLVLARVTLFAGI